jgi:NAD(P)-dependent dehydrogenase (short-subunit alcohol dehydrogenase family)
MTSISLAGKVAVVTGASSGIGRATAKTFAANGASVVVAARREAELESLVAEITESGGSATLLCGDVRSEAFAEALVGTAVDSFGGLDVAFNNAGSLGAAGPAVDLTLAAWQETMDTNLTAGFLGAKYQIPAMLERGGGSLIFTSSFVGSTVAFPGMSAYGASKAGLIGLVKVLAVEYGAQGIRANALLPGGTQTEMADSFAPTEEALDAVRALMALKRIAQPEEIAQSALYLASDASSFTTGTAMLVDGGVSINR